METLWQDLKYGARQLARSPGFTTIAVLTLALGIGTTTAIFGAVNPILFERLPYPQSERMVAVWDHGADGSPLEVTFGTARELQERSRSFDALAVAGPWQPTLTGAGEPERLEGQRVSAGYFRVLGVGPALGRDFDASEDTPNGSKAVILSDALWRRRFGGDATMVGRPMVLDDDNYVVVGVMPREFENVLAPSADVWTTLQYDMSQGRAWGHHLRMVGRVRAGIEIEQAGRELDLIAATSIPEFPRPTWASLGNGLMVRSLREEMTVGVKPALLAVLGAVALLLAIACVNVTNLLLARGAGRRAEFAVRAALGAARTRVLRQLLTESLLLALLGGMIGVMVAQFGVGALVALSPPGLPRVAAIGVDGAVFAFAFGLSALVGFGVGFMPALHVYRSDLRGELQRGPQRAVGGHHHTRNTLVVAEMALALLLLVSAGLLLRSVQQLFAVDPGFEGQSLLTMQVQASGRRFDDSTTDRFFAEALVAARQAPGVAAAAFTSQLPLSSDLDEYGVQFERSDSGQPEESYPAFRYAVSPGYFETMGIPLRQGRLLGTGDTANAPPVVLISESLARKRFAGQDPVGRRVHVGPTDRPWYTIAGVVGDVKQLSLASGQSDAVYVTTEQWPFADRAMWLVARAREGVKPALLAPPLREAIWSVDKNQPIVRIASMNDLLSASGAERRFALTVFGAFAVAALALAATGIFGVVSYSVTQRTQEIGIRMALGAQRLDVFRLVVGNELRLIFLGVGFGLVGALALTRLMKSLLFGVSATDPVTFAVTVALLVAVALVACWVPARRAARVDPMVAVRYE